MYPNSPIDYEADWEGNAKLKKKKHTDKNIKKVKRQLLPANYNLELQNTVIDKHLEIVSNSLLVTALLCPLLYQG